MADNVEFAIIAKDEFSKVIDKAADSMGDLEKTFEVTEESAKTLVKQFEDLGVNTDEMSEAFLAMNPEVKKSVDLLEELGITSGNAGEKIKEMEKEQKASENQSKKVAKGLGGMAKGLVGVATAYAGGRAIIGFAKDSLGAAKAAGTLNPALGELNETIQDLKVLVGTGLGNALAPLAKGADNVISSHTEVLKGVDAIDDAYEKGKITLDQQSELLHGFNDSLNTELDLQRAITKTTKERIEASKAGRGLTGRDALDDEVLRRRGRDPDRERRAGQDTSFFEGIDTGFGGAITSAMQDIDFAQAGGKEFQEQIASLISAIDTGDIDLELGEDLLSGAFVEWERFQMEVGNLSLMEAGKNIQAEFGGTLQEAFNLLREESDMSWLTTQIDQALADTEGMLDFGVAEEQVAGIEQALSRLDDTTINVTVNIPDWLSQILGELQ